MGVSREPEGACCEARDSSEVSRHRSALRLRRDLEDAVDQAGTASRNLQQLPSVLHRPPEAGGHRRTGRALHEALWRADLRVPQAGREDQEGGGYRDEVRAAQSGWVSRSFLI